MESNENNFKNVIDVTPKKGKNHNIKNHVILPFFSGVLGCSVVLGTCFGVPSIRENILGSSTSGVTTSASSSSKSDTSVGTVDYVSLENYSDTAVYAANKILPSIVGIEVTYSVTTNSMFSMFGGGQSQESTATASGSGIIISADGYILTNNHVVSSSSESTYYEISEATKIKITLFGNDSEYEATIVGKDSQTDLAVLKIDAEDLTPAEFADSDSVKIGEFCMAVGNPLGLGATITCGVVSALNREVTDSEGTTYTCIQTDAAINSGNSGGALVNSQGQVIGINTLKVSSTGVEGIGFSIPVNSTTDVISDLITYNKVRRPYIGIQGRDITESVASQYSNLVEGIYVVSVEEYSAAELAGIKAGDIITAIDGTEVKTMDELNEIKNTHSIGDTVTLKIYRDGSTKDVTVTLGESSSE